MLYDKIKHEGWSKVENVARGKAKWCVCHQTPPQVLYFIVQHKHTVLLLVCWFCVGGLITLGIEVWENGLAKKQKRTITSCYSLSLLPNQWEMNGVKELVYNVMQNSIFSSYV